MRTTYLEFSCIKCSKTYLQGTGSDSGSTGVMRDHIRVCWGEDVWNEAKDLDLDPAKDVVKKFKTLKNVKLTEMFSRVPGSKETYSLIPPSREEIRYGHFRLKAPLLIPLLVWLLLAGSLSQCVRFVLSRTEAYVGSVKPDDLISTSQMRQLWQKISNFYMGGQSVT